MVRKKTLSFHEIGKAFPTFHLNGSFRPEHCFVSSLCWLTEFHCIRMVLFFLIFFCVSCVWGRHSSTCSYPLLQRRRGFLHHIAWLLPKATPAGINLSLASKTTFLQTCCSKKEVSHLQSLPRNFCVDSTLSDFDFWISLFVLHQQHGQLLAPGETFSRTEERVWHILCLSRFSAQGKSGIPRADVCTSLIAVVCWETLVDCSIWIHYYLSCLLVTLFVWICCLVWFGLVFSLGCLVCLGLLLVSIQGSSHENWHSILRNGLKKLGTGSLELVVYGWSTIGFPLVRPY